ncbi:MAG TPA: SAM-dependent methyltransferase [Streptosporangiaceae bacterium]|nr:SAM-dependent methyltransferase [Streptosporangiaceae bacterium]
MAREDAWLHQVRPGADAAGEARGPAPRLDTHVAYSARVNNYWRGGKDNFASDRKAAEQALKAFPALPEAIRAGQAFRRRAARYLVSEAGIRQFLDLGTGLPTGDTIYQIAESLAPGCRAVYVDNDPMVLTHARALLGGSCAYVDADLRDVGAVLAETGRTLDLAQPVAVILSSVLHLIPDADDPYGIVGRLMNAAVPGSALVIVHPASDIRPEASAGMAASLNQLMAQKRTYRGHAGVSRFFSGLELADPGVVRVPDWRPDNEMEASAPTMAWCGVARKSAHAGQAPG